MLNTKYQGFRFFDFCGFRQEDFLYFFYMRLWKTCSHQESHFWPQGHNLNKHGRCLLGDATYQISRLLSKPCGFRKECLFMFSYISLFKTCDPRVGGCIFDPRGITNLVKVHLVMPQTQYQCFRPCGFRREDFFHFSCFSYISLGRGSLGNATYQISRLLAFWLQTRFFHVFPIYAFEKHVNPGGGHFGPMGHNELGKGPLGYATNQISMF